MSQTEELGEWPRAWTALVGRAVADQRRRRGLSAQQVSDRCKALGHEMPRSIIANIENGRREALPVHEVTVLAAALGTSPLELLFPLELVDRVPVLPGVSEPSLRAEEWFSGLESRDGDRLDVGSSMSVIATWRAHDGHLRECRYWLRHLRDIADNLRASESAQGDDWVVWLSREQGATASMEGAVETLRAFREQMFERGQQLPDLPADVARLVEVPSGVGGQASERSLEGEVSRRRGQRVEQDL